MNRYQLKKGILIAIEGIDGVGKTTQISRLKEHYERNGYSVVTLKEPTNGEYGQKIRNLAKYGRESVTAEEEMRLFINDRIEDCKKNIIPALNAKKIVFIDRYYFSSIAYQGALGLDVKYIARENEAVAVIPDLVVIVDAAVKIGLSRISNQRNETPNHFEQEEYLEKVRAIFRQMSAPYIQLIDGSRQEDEVFTHLKNIIDDIISNQAVKISSQQELFPDKTTISFTKN